MALKGFEKLHKIANKANSIKKSPSIKKGGLLNRIKQAENLAYEKLGKYSDVYKCFTSREEIEHFLFDYEPFKSKSSIQIDCETGPRDLLHAKKDDALDFYRGHIVGFSLTRPDEESCYIPVNHIDPATMERLINQVTPQDISEILNRFLKERPLVTFDYSNAEFDIRMFIHSFDVNLIDSFGWDDMIVEHCIDENGSHKLKVMDKKYYPQDYVNVKEGDIEIVEFRDLFGDVPYATISPKAATLYAAGDTHKTLRVKKKQIEWLSLPENEKLFNLIKKVELPIVKATLRMEERGIDVDIDYLNKLEEKYNQKLEIDSKNCYAELAKYEDKIKDYRLKFKGKKCKVEDPLNISSVEQINIFLYDILGIKLKENDPKKDHKKNETSEEKESADKKALFEIRRRYPTLKPFINYLLSYRYSSKMVSTYITAIREKIRDDGKIHCTFLPYGTVTGRFSSKNPNLQNIPRNPEFRRIFYGGPGFYVGGGDFSKQEVFLTVEESQDTDLAKVFKDGKDIYSVLAQSITGFDYWDCIEWQVDENHNFIRNEHGAKVENVEGHARRSLGKVGWLGISYGMGAASLANKANEDKKLENDKKIENDEELTEYDLKMTTVEEAKKVLEAIHRDYPIVTKWIEYKHKFCKEHNYTESKWGRRRNLPAINLPKYSIDLIYPKGSKEPLCPVYLEEDPLDFETNYEKREINLNDIPEEVYKPYIDAINKATSSYKIKEITEQLKEKERLGVRSNGQEIAKAERQSVNASIQGQAGVLIKYCMILIDNDPILRKYNSGLISSIHDEVLIAIPKEQKDLCLSRVVDLMIQGAQQMVKLVDVKVDPVLQDRWSGDDIDFKYESTVEKYPINF